MKEAPVVTAVTRISARWRTCGVPGRVTAGTWSRVLVNGKVIEKSPESLRGYRTLPVDAMTIAALKALRDLQAIEAIDAVPAYGASGYVATDELGAAVNPEWLSDEFHRLSVGAGLPRIRVHDVRHTASSLMATAGVLMAR